MSDPHDDSRRVEDWLTRGRPRVIRTRGGVIGGATLPAAEPTVTSNATAKVRWGAMIQRLRQLERLGWVLAMVLVGLVSAAALLRVQEELRALQGKLLKTQSELRLVGSQLAQVQENVVGVLAGMTGLRGQVEGMQILQERAQKGRSNAASTQLRDAKGQVEVTWTADGQLSLSGIRGLHAEREAQIKGLLINAFVPPDPEVWLAMSRLREYVRGRGEGQEMANGPLLLYPTDTVVRSVRPTFRWRPMEGADRYQLIVRDLSLNLLWSGEVGDRTSFSLPPEVPGLQRGTAYTWQVTASAEGKEKGFSVGQFWVLSDKALSEIEQAERAYPGSALVLGAVYEESGLYEEAEAQFRALQDRNPDSPLPARFLEGLQAQRAALSRPQPE